MNLNKKLILSLSFGCYILLSIFVSQNQSPPLNPRDGSIEESIFRLTSGPQNRSVQSVPSLQKSLDSVPKVSKNSIASNSKLTVSPKESGNKVRYYPNDNPGGGSGKSGCSSNDFEPGDWESTASCPNSDQVISNLDFWNNYLDFKDCCPNVNIELEEEDDDLSYNDLVEIPEEITARQRRKLFDTPLTAQLDKAVQKQFNSSNEPIKPFYYMSREGIELTMKNKELDKVVYAYSKEIGLLNIADRIECPLYPDPSKFQIIDCRAVTDVSKREAIARIMQLTTSVDPNYITRKLLMPSFNSQEAYAFIQKDTRACLLFHVDSGKLWSGKQLSPAEMEAMINNEIILLNHQNSLLFFRNYFFL